jgi:putative transposase
MNITLNILETFQNIMGAKLVDLGQLSKGYWSHTGKFSITNVSRWTIGGSTRTNERFYASSHNWVKYTLTLVCAFLMRVQKENPSMKTGYFIAFDETVGKKAGKSTYGIGYHYSSKDQRVVKSIAVLGISLIHQPSNLSIPIIQEQFEHPTVSKAEKAVKKKKKSDATAKKSEKKKRGRPKGSKNKVKKDPKKVEIAYTFQVLQRNLNAFVLHSKESLAPLIECNYAVGDGGFGNNSVAKICLSIDKNLISKLQFNAALHFTFTGEYCGRGPHRKYGDKINYDTFEIDHANCLVEKQKQKDGSTWHIYQLDNMLHRNFDMPLNVVVIYKYDNNGTHKGQRSNAVLFSTDMSASSKTIISYYQARFQIEFDFRDARQYFGLSHFKNVKKTQVTNVIGFAFFMVTLSRILLFELKNKQQGLNIGIQDIKSFFRAEKYFNELLNMDGFQPSIFLNKDSFCNIPIVGRINAA